MNNPIKINEEYKDWIQSLSKRYRQSQLKAAIAVNEEMLRFYWSLGKDIIELQAESVWGSGFFDKLSVDLQHELPNVKGFSPRNLRYMKSFYLLYSQLSSILPQAGAKLQSIENEDAVFLPQAEAKIFSIPWGHHKYIIDRNSNNPQKAFFFVQKTIENGWSRAVLLNFLDTDLYERQGRAVSNFKNTLPVIQSELAQEITRDPYNFDFLSIIENYKEKELKDALIQNITKFLLELGTGFAYIGKEYRLQIGQTEKFLDMLFYNLKLRCYVVVEIKVVEFDTENIGQLGTYVAAVNHLLKQPDDNPTIGLLICKTKDNVLAQYALEASSQPIGISEYELSNLYPEEFKGTLPSIEDIENELKN